MVRTAKRAVPVFVCSLLLVTPTLAADPSGEATLAADSTAPLTFIWLVMATALVFFMQAGFLLVEAGFARARNTVNIICKNMVDFIIAALAFWAFGYAFMYGGGPLDAFIGLTGFGLFGEGYDVSNLLAWSFQMVFAATAATIVSGAMSERTRLPAYMACSFLITALLYPIFGNWVWGDNGWLGALGAHDFAGSGVVHALGGGVALVGAKLVGPRRGKYDEAGGPRPMPAHNLVYVAIGTLILLFGWIGFNGGSTLDGSDLRVSVIVANTLLAAAAGGFTALYINMVRTRGVVDLSKICNGILAGLVGVTAPCAVVAPWAAVLIGAIAGGILIWSERFVEQRLRIDDPVGAVSVHGTCGLWGLVAVGIFADGTYGDIGGLITGRVDLLMVQLFMAVVVALWSMGGGYIIFRFIRGAMGLRVSEEEEVTGLDISEHGMEAYGGEPVPNPLGASGD